MKSVFLALLLATTPVFAMGGKNKDQVRKEQFKKELNLSDEQVQKFQALKEKKGELRAMKTKFKETKKAFKAAMADPNLSPDELKVKFEDFMKQRDEFQRRRFAHHLEMRAILNPDQIVKFNEMKAKWHGKKKGKEW